MDRVPDPHKQSMHAMVGAVRDELRKHHSPLQESRRKYSRCVGDGEVSSTGMHSLLQDSQRGGMKH